MQKIWFKKKIYFNYFIIFLLIVLLLSGTTIQAQKMAEDDVDQEQTIGGEEIPIFKDNWAAQSFSPTVNEITRMQLKLKQKGNIGGNLTLIIRSFIIGSDIIKVLIPPENITNEPSWVNIEFTDNVSVVPESMYYIICYLDDGDENNNIVWYRGTNTTYERGLAYNSEDNGSSWIQNIDKDFCFKTFGEVIKEGSIEILHLVGKANFPGGKIEFAIKNTGNVTIKPINVQMNFYGGFILLGRSFTETYDIQLKPGQTLNFNIYPILGIGSVQCTLSVGTTDVLPTIKTADAYLLLFYVYIRPDF
jgi:hypothetical protein